MGLSSSVVYGCGLKRNFQVAPSIFVGQLPNRIIVGDHANAKMGSMILLEDVLIEDFSPDVDSSVAADQLFDVVTAEQFRRYGRALKFLVGENCDRTTNWRGNRGEFEFSWQRIGDDKNVAMVGHKIRRGETDIFNFISDAGAGRIAERTHIDAAPRNIGPQLPLGRLFRVSQLTEDDQNQRDGGYRQNTRKYCQWVIDRLGDKPGYIIVVSVFFGVFRCASGIALYLNSRASRVGSVFGLALVALRVLTPIRPWWLAFFWLATR